MNPPRFFVGLLGGMLLVTTFVGTSLAITSGCKHKPATEADPDGGLQEPIRHTVIPPRPWLSPRHKRQ